MSGTDGPEHEVCVVGGGPAGATLARRLARLGHEVLVVEASAFPRPHIGESLPASIDPILRAAGVRDSIERAGFLRPAGAIVQWSGTVGRRRGDGAGPGFQVDRGRFDALLLEAARVAGARVCQPARARRPLATAAGWSIPLEGPDGPGRVRARFLVDAAGKQAAMPRRRVRSSVPTVAMYGYWRQSALAGPETRVEAGRAAWYWGAPLPDGSLNAVVFVDPQACAGVGRGGLEGRYRALLARSRLLGGCLAGRLESPVRTCDAATYFEPRPATRTSIAIGEAAYSIDPLSSQGVQAAMTSALQAAAVVHTILTQPADADAALEFYEARQAEAVERDRRVAGALYAEQDAYAAEPFWRRRALVPSEDPAAVPARPALDASSRLHISEATRVLRVPALEADLIRPREALAHPALERPVAFLDDVPVVPLLRQLEPGWTAAQILEAWSRSLPAPRAREVLSWMCDRGILAGPMGEPPWA